MKIIASVMILVLAATFVNAQEMNNLNQMNGSPLAVGRKDNVEGNPYYKTTFCYATLHMNDRDYPEVKTKLNLLTNVVSFVRPDDAEEKEYTPSYQVTRILFTGCRDKGGNPLFKLGYPAIGIQNENTYYQVLDSGKTQLLKYTQVVETAKPVNGFTANDGTTILQKVETYYLYSPSKGIVKISKSNDDVLKALADKKAEIENYITTNRFKTKKEEDLLTVVKYYNTLN